MNSHGYFWIHGAGGRACGARRQAEKDSALTGGLEVGNIVERSAHP